MTTPLDLPALDKLHAEATQGDLWESDGGGIREELVCALVNAFPALSARLKLLEQTLRGVIEEKRKQRAGLMDELADRGMARGQSYAVAAHDLDQQIAWLERALGGEL